MDEFNMSYALGYQKCYSDLLKFIEQYQLTEKRTEIDTKYLRDSMNAKFEEINKKVEKLKK